MALRQISKKSLDRVCAAMEKHYPLHHAERSWDNVGLLIDSSEDKDVSSSASEDTDVKVLLAVDLTTAVCDEAISTNTNVIVAYHPFLFGKFNRIEPSTNSQHKSLLKLIRNNISVYSPHTAVDAAKGGVNDWLCDQISGKFPEADRQPIIKATDGTLGVGMGRIVQLQQPVAMRDIVARVKTLSNQPYVQISGDMDDNTAIKSYAVCAGSGASVFRGLTDVQLYITGELSHHEQLALVNNGAAVIMCGHCSSERGYLNTIKDNLHAEGITATISTADKPPVMTV